MNILFSPKADWEQWIRDGFTGSRHAIAFAEFADADLEAHDLLVPITLAALRDLQARPESAARNPIAIPSAESMALCDDKLAFNRFLEGNGFVDCVPPIGPFQSFPYILKKRHDEWGRNSHIVRDRGDEERLAAELADPEFFCQEYIPGSTELTTHIVFRDGRIVCGMTLALRFGNEVYIRGREADLERTECACADEELFTRILVAIGFEGLCCFNYKRVGTQPLIFEINPRFGASLAPLFAQFLERFPLGAAVPA